MGARRRVHDRLSISHLQSIVRYQEAMLRDRPRNRAFLRALKKTIWPGARVLDVGSGSGLWAVAAARMGAGRVVAVEREPLLRPVIERLVAENGVADRVEVISHEFRHADLVREFDVVVSETVGSRAFEEDIVPIMVRARDDLLVPGGALVPDVIVFRAAPVSLRWALPDPPSLLPQASSLRQVVAQVPRPLFLHDYDLLAPACDLARVDLKACSADHTELGDVAGSWSLDRGDTVDGIAVWLRLRLAPRVWLETRGSGAWSVTLFPLERFAGRRGRLQFRLQAEAKRDRWQAVLESDRGREESEHCPEFAYGSILAAHRRASRPVSRRRRPS